jgi:AbiV family abortive infection protein
MKKESIEQYNRFRRLCLQNATSNLKGAARHQGQGENHLILHLCLLALEEVGKVFLGWVQLKNRETGEPVTGMLDMEDHVRKLFWAIWGPSFAQELLTAEQWRENEGMATKMHQLRLFSLYTALEDTVPNNEKIDDQLAIDIYTFTQSRLDLAQAEGAVDESESFEPDALQEKFFQLTRDPARRNRIFSVEFQQKLVELGKIPAWIAWLVEQFEAEEARLPGLLLAELTRQPDRESMKFTPKWRISYLLVTPTHTIRPKVSQIVATYAPYIRLRATDDRSELEVDLDLDQVVPITQVYQQGLVLSHYFAAALSVGSRGVFWWNARIEPGKYYEKILDLSSNTRLSAHIGTFPWQWPQQKTAFQEHHIQYSHMVFGYFLSLPHTRQPEWLGHYIAGLAMLATIDVHLPLGLDAFMRFHAAFQKAVMEHEKTTEGHLRDYGYHPLEQLVTDKATFVTVIDKAEALLNNRPPNPPLITLQEILQLKSYCDWYFLTLAARHVQDDPNLRLTLLREKEEENQETKN